MESKRNSFSALIAFFLIIVPHLCIAARIGPARSDPAQQAQAAISTSWPRPALSSTVSALAKSGGLKPREAAAVNDCMVTVGASVDELQRSLGALRSANGGKKLVVDQVKNVQTWVSAALTDETTCMEGFADGSMDGEAMKTIRGQIVKVAQLISNALGLVSGLCNKSHCPLECCWITC